MKVLKELLLTFAALVVCLAVITVTVFLMVLCWKLGVGGADAVLGMIGVR